MTNIGATNNENFLHMFSNAQTTPFLITTNVVKNTIANM